MTTAPFALPQSPQCLLSDCDGVIVDSELIAERIMYEVLGEVFGPAVPDLLRGLFGHTVDEHIRHLETRLERPLPSDQRRALRYRIDAEVADQAPAMADVLAVYPRLRLPIGVVSNSDFHRVRRSVERSGLGPLIGAHVFSAEGVGRPKPAPDLYLHAARRMGVPPAACVVVEDSVVGVRAASAAGMPVLGFVGGSHVDDAHGEKLRQAGALHVFDRLLELPALIGIRIE